MSDVFEQRFGVKAQIKLEEKKYIAVNIKTSDDFFEDISFERLLGEGNPKLDVMMRSHWEPTSEMRRKLRSG
tara:strand:+ start:324 stop:539 length:216 start_codon:yes stop_codon:yes gene_type:complete